MSSISPTGGNPPVPIFSSFPSVTPSTNPPSGPLVTDFLLSNTGLVTYQTVLTNLGEHPALASPEMSLSEFFKLINSAIRENVQRQKNDNSTDPLLDRNLNISIASNATILIQDFISLVKIARTYQSLFSKMQKAIDDYNAANQLYTQQNLPDQNAIDALNDAINRYNNGEISLQEEQDAIASYNLYVAQRGPGNPPHDASVYNTALDKYLNLAANYNAQIEELNHDRAGFGLPLLNLLPTSDLIRANTAFLPNAPLSIIPPIPNVLNTNPTTFPTVNVTISEGESETTLITTIYEPLAQAFQEVLNRIRKGQELFFSFYNLRTFLLPNAKNPYTVNTITSYTPPPNSSSSSSTGSGASVGNMLTSLYPTESTNILTQGLEKDLLKNVSKNTALKSGAEQFLASLKSIEALYGLDLVLKNSLVSALPALSLLSNSLTKQGVDSPALRGTLSLITASNLFASTGADTSQKAFLNLIHQTLGEDFPGAENLSKQLAAAFNLGIIQFGLANLAFSLGLPGLVPQAVANLSGLSPELVQSAASPNLTLIEVLQNPVSVSGISSSLASALTGQGNHSADEALLINTNALAAVAGQLGRFATNSDIRRALEQQYIAAGLDAATSRKLTNQALDLIRADQAATLDVRSQNINYNTDRELRDQLAADAIAQGTARSAALAEANSAIGNFNFSLVNQGVLQTSIQNQLQSLGIENAENIAGSVIQGLVSDAITSEEILRDNIRSILRKEGVERKDARDIAIAADIQNTNIQAGIQTQGLQTILTPAELTAQIKQAAYEKFLPELGNDLALELGNRFANAVIGGENSFVARANDAIRTIKESQREKIDERLVESFRASMQPNLDLYSQQLYDPAYNLTKSLMTGLMYDRPLPSNYDHSRGMMV